MNIWQELNCAPTTDPRSVKRAYAARVKQVHPEDDPEGFQRLRAAYEQALRLTEQAAADTRPPEQPPPTARITEETAPAPAAVEPPPATIRPSINAATVQHTAARLCAYLVGLPPHKRLVHLRSELQRTDCELLDYRAALEHAVAAELTARFDDYWTLVPVFGQEFGWGEARDVSQRLDPRIGELGHRFQARDWRVSLETAPGLARSPYRRAWALLTGPFDEKAFKRFARRSSHLKAMETLLDELRTHQRAALHFEVNQESARWWWSRLGDHRLTVDRALGLGVWGVLTAVLPILMLANFLLDTFGFDLLEHRVLAPLALLAMVSVPFLVDGITRWYRRAVHRGRFQSFATTRQRWQEEPRRRRVLIAVAVTSVALTSAMSLASWLGVFALLGAGIVAFWYGLPYVLAVGLVLATPLTIAAVLGSSILASELGQRWLELEATGPVLALHLLIVLLFAPMQRLMHRGSQRLLKRTVQNPGQALFLAGLAMTVILAFVGAQLATPAQKASPSAASERITAKPRPQAEVEARAAEMQQRLDAVYRLFFSPDQPAPAGAELHLRFSVAPDGRVTRVLVEKSDFANAAFDQAVAEAVGKMQYGASPSYALTEFTYGFRDSPEAEFRPPTEVRQRSADIQTVVQRARARAFGDAGHPDPIAMKLSFTVQPDGSVSSVETDLAGRNQPVLASEIAAGLEALRFEPRPQLRPTRYIQEFNIPATSPPPPPRRPRPGADVETVLASADSRFRALVAEHYAGRALPPDARMSVEFTIRPDGRVSDASIADSTYQDAAFEQRVADLVRGLRYPPNERYFPTRFTFRLNESAGAPTPASP